MIAVALRNFTVTLFLVAIMVAIATILVRRPTGRDGRAEAFLAPFLFFSVGVSFLYNFVVHVFFGEMAARFIGWSDSPFQAEVGFASLGFAAVGFFAVFAGRGARIAAVLGPSLFTLGAAAGHLRQMVTAGNFAPGNAGTVFFADILLPVIGAALLAWRYGAPTGAGRG